MTANTPRNAPCPCGSGRRYKDCHGALVAGSLSSGHLPGAASKAQLQPQPSGSEAWRHALTLDADNAEAHFHLANLAMSNGHAQEAIDHYEHALRSAPQHAGILNNLGLAYAVVGDDDRAQASYRRALQADPMQADALSNLADSLVEGESFREASAVFERLFIVRREHPAATWVQRGMAHQQLGDLEAAESCFRAGARIDPSDVRIQLNLGTVCSELKRFAEAEHAWSRVLERDPRNAHALSMLAHDRQHQCAWEGLDSLFSTLNAMLEDDDNRADFRINPFAVLAMPSSPLAQLHAAQRWAAPLSGAGASLPRMAISSIAQRRPLRVGFVSSDFRDHPMAHLSMEYWERLDRDRLETFAYGIRAADTGPVGQRIERAFAHFDDVSALSADDIARRIQSDRLDILFDLNGYTTHSRERVLALRPAPIQINCIGFPGTLGAHWYDYVYCDPVSVTQAMETDFTERALRMPHMSFPSDTTRAASKLPVLRAACGLPDGAFVFCCFNNAYKILPPVFSLWMRLLGAVDGSVLWLLETSSEATRNLQREAARAGIDSSRLVFAPKVSIAQHLARHAAADLFIDTFPYGAHTTANDALLAGLPLVTCAGDTLVSRIAASQLCAIGLPELVARDLASYESLALRLARNRAELASLRGRLHANRHTHALFDMTRYARDFEDLMFSACERHRAYQAI